MPSNPDAVRQLWQLFAREKYRDVRSLLADSFTADWGLTRERLPSPEAFIRVQEEYPGHGTITPIELIDDGTKIVTITRVQWSDGGDYQAISLWTFDAAGLIAGVTEWWPDPSEPAPNRSHLVERY